MHSASAIVTFQSSGTIEVRAEPGDRYQLELRTESGNTRTPVYDWLVGERPTAVQLIRYHRGEAVEERRVARGGAARVDVADLADTLRLRAASPVGPPASLELRLIEQVVIPEAATPSPAGLPPLPGPDKPRPHRPLPARTTPPPRPKGTINDLVGAIDRRLAQRLQPLLDKMCAVELHLEGGADPIIGASELDHTDPVADAFGQVREALAGLDGRLVDGLDAEGIKARMEGLASGIDGLRRALEEADEADSVLARIDEVAEGLGARIDALGASGGGAEVGDQLEALTLGIEQAFEALAARIPPALDLAPVLTHLAALTERIPGPVELGPLEARLDALGPLQAGLSALQGAVDGLSDDQLDPVALVERLTTQLGEVVKNTQDAGFEPLFAGLDRAEQDRARLGEQVGALADRFMAIEDRLNASVAEQFERTQTLLERVHGVVSGPSTDANRLAEVFEQLRRVERALMAAPSMDGKLTALGSQLRRIEETAGAITPEVFEIIAARLEAVDPRPSFSATAERMEAATQSLEAALSARVGAITDAVEARLEARLGEATPLAGRLARLEQAVADRPDTAWLTRHVTALADTLADVDRATDATLGQLPALVQRLEALAELLGEVHARPAFPADLEARLVAVEAQIAADAEAVNARLDTLGGHLTALAERPAPIPVDPRPALEGIQDGMDRLERRVRNDGNHADRAMAAAVAAMRAVGNDDQFEAIEERLVRMERALGGASGGSLDPALVARFEAAAAKAAEAPAPDGQVGDKLEIITGHLRTLTTRPMPVPAPDTEISDRLEALAAQVASLASGSAAGGVPPEFAERLAELNAHLEAQLEGRPDAAVLERLDALAARLEAQPVGEGVPPEGAPGSAIEARLDALAAQIEALAQRPAPAAAPDEGLGARVDALTMQIEALAQRPAAAAPDEGLGARVDALAAQIDALAQRPAPVSTAAGVDPLLVEHLEGLGDRIDALARAQVEVTASVQALELSHPMPATPVPPPVPAVAEMAGLDIDFDDEDDFEIEIEIEEPQVRPEVARRSPDGQMLDQIELLIDVVHTQHIEQSSMRGALGPMRLDALAERIRALRGALAGDGETGSAGRLLGELEERIEAGRVDPLLVAQTALIEGDFARSVELVVRALRADEQAPLSSENVERTLVGIATALWDADAAWFEHDEARPALDTLLAELHVTLVVPELNTSWEPKSQRVQARRPGQAGQALNRILEVNAPGFSRGDEVIEKAAVTISD